LNGYSVFALSTPGTEDSEGTVALDSRLSSSVVMPYDNTRGYHTGMALANQSSSPATITIIVLDPNGVQLGSSQINLPAFGHQAFFLSDRFPTAANQLGIFELQGAGNVTAIGLRFNPTGSFTSTPIIR
jgi:hypothetical protein